MLFPCDFIFISPFLGCGWSISLRQDNACNGFPETDPQFRSPEWVRRAPPESQSCDIASGLNFLHVCRLDAAPLPNPFTHVAQNCHGIHACQNPVYSCPFQTITILVPTLQWQLAKTELLLIKMNKIKCIIKIATWLDLWLETCAQCIDWHDIWAQHFTTKGKMELVHKTKDGLLNHFQSLTTTLNLTKVWHGFCRSPLTKRIIYCILAGGENMEKTAAMNLMKFLLCNFVQSFLGKDDAHAKQPSLTANFAFALVGMWKSIWKSHNSLGKNRPRSSWLVLIDERWPKAMN